MWSRSKEAQCIDLIKNLHTYSKSAYFQFTLIGKSTIWRKFFFFCGQTTLTIFCCLLFPVGVLFTNRAFEELVLGLSWRGNPELDGVGGICQSRVRIKSDRNAYSFNALFISLKSLQEIRIPLRMGVLNLGRCKMQKSYNINTDIHIATMTALQ